MRAVPSGHQSVATVRPRRNPAQLLAVLPRLSCGLAVVVAPTCIPRIRDAGLEPLGPLLGVALVVAGLFGNVPRYIAWAQRLGAWLFPGIVAAGLVLLLPRLVPAPGRESSVVAFSPSVWAAYASIVAVNLSFELSGIPTRIHRICRASAATPSRLIPAYVVVAGLLGNVLDGVSIIAISTVVFLSLLPARWAVRSAFAMLFGGLVSNLVTVAAEPTNIKFQDGLHSVLDAVRPDFWFGNWPICVLSVTMPALVLGVEMRIQRVAWRTDEPEPPHAFEAGTRSNATRDRLSLCAIGLLATGILGHAVIHARSAGSADSGAGALPLWLLILPAGVMGSLHLRAVQRIREARERLAVQWPVCARLMVIFSLLWFVSNGVERAPTMPDGLLSLGSGGTFAGMIGLSLLSAVTDNVAVAAMQSSLILVHPLAVWKIRMLFVLLTWSGGFTPFGCLQSLALNARLGLTSAQWFREARIWSALALAGGLAGLLLAQLMYPSAA